MKEGAIYKKLSDIQGKLSVPKNQFNNFGKYNYRSCEDIVEEVKPLLKEHKVVMLISDTMKNVGDRIYVQALVTLTCIEDNSMVSVTGWAREAAVKKGMDDSQITGSTSSYARKYALNGLFAIDDTKDADSMKPEEETPPSSSKKDKKPEQPKRNWIKEIQTTTTLDELKGVFTEVQKATEGEELGKIIMEKDKQKQILLKEK